MTAAPPEPEPRSQDATGVVCVVLAAGASTRMGRKNKLVESVGGTPMVKTVVRAALESRADSVMVITGSDRGPVEACLADLPVDVRWNPDHGLGLSASLKKGIVSLPDGTRGVVVCLADMPSVSPRDIDALIEAFLSDVRHSIFVPTWQGRRGNPVLWSAGALPRFDTLTGDTGAKTLMARDPSQVREVPVEGPGVFSKLCVLLDVRG